MKLGHSAQDTWCSFPFARVNSYGKVFANTDEVFEPMRNEKIQNWHYA